MTMELNSLHPAPGAKKRRKRVGRGVGSGVGKTCGRGQKGQKSRSGAKIRPWFEGGQLPLQMRVPKFGFRSRVGLTTAEVRLGELGKVAEDVADLASLKAANVVTRNTKRVRVMLSGAIDRPLTVRGIKLTPAAAAAVEAAGGTVEAAAGTQANVDTTAVPETGPAEGPREDTAAAQADAEAQAETEAGTETDLTAEADADADTEASADSDVEADSADKPDREAE